MDLDCGHAKVALRGIADAYDRLIDDYRDLEWDYNLLLENNRKLSEGYMALLMKIERKGSVSL